MKIARSGKELLEICAAEQISLSEYAIRQEMELKNVSREDLFAQMKITLDAMKESATADKGTSCIQKYRRLHYSLPPPRGAHC